ncbi:hypothetical protein NKI79_02890 [Mesorhizobium sp. M0340]|uniref:hypothetical protein n=1 Tax=Mesorhizobium sp. M0340 TaxID=2956939 RepID=UPI0033399C6A
MKMDMAIIGSGPVLSGSINGKAAFAAFVKAIDREPAAPTPLFLDFTNIDVATASYLRESVFALKAYMRTLSSKYYPVVANINDDIWDELLIVANAKGDAIMSCRLDRDERVSGAELIGSLDPKQQMTFDLVNEYNGVDANHLMEKFGEAEQTKSTTAWNNRLASLAARGVIREFAQGRSKYYRPLFEEVI